MKRRQAIVVCILCLAVSSVRVCAQDKIELLSGISMKAKIVKVSDESVTVKIGSTEKTFPLEQIHAITQDGERRVVNEKGERPAASSKKAEKEEEAEDKEKGKEKGKEKAKDKEEEKEKAKEGEKEKEAEAEEEKDQDKDKDTAAKSDKKKKKDKKKKLSPKKIESFIAKAEKDKPDWWDDVELQVPQDLNMGQWRAPAGTEGAEAEKYPGNYIWAKMVPNQDRWKEAIKLCHACLKEAKGKDDAAIKLDLAGYYKNLLNDYPRAAFYYRQCGANMTAEMGLGDCYAELGGDAMAMDLYKKHEKTVGRDADVVRRYTRLGDTKLALKVGEAMIAASKGRDQAIALLACGDAARAAEDYKAALGFYEKVKDVEVPQLDTPKKTEDERNRIEQIKHRADDATRTIKLYENLDLSKIPDGSYEGKAKGYASEIQVRVTIAGGKIEKVEVLSHKETRFYTALTSIPEQIVENQGLKVDAVTNATVSSDAVVTAVAAAIEEAMKK